MAAPGRSSPAYNEPDSFAEEDEEAVAEEEVVVDVVEEVNLDLRSEEEVRRCRLAEKKERKNFV